MRVPVLSTSNILMRKAFNQDIDESWIDWAIEMIQAGFESDNLYMLAGATKPFNQFELQELTSKVLSDLQLDYSDKEKVIRDYLYFIVTTALNDSTLYLSTLREMKDICIDMDMDKNYMDFYLLYFAKEDLIDFEDQWYWEGANRKNIDEIIKAEFQNFIDRFDKKERQTTA